MLLLLWRVGHILWSCNCSVALYHLSEATLCLATNRLINALRLRVHLSDIVLTLEFSHFIYILNRVLYQVVVKCSKLLDIKILVSTYLLSFRLELVMVIRRYLSTASIVILDCDWDSSGRCSIHRNILTRVRPTVVQVDIAWLTTWCERIFRPMRLVWL